MSITLKPHNIVAYDKVKEKYEEDNRTAVIQPTGTGKMYIALKFIEDNKEKKAIYIAPSNAILHDVKKNIFAEGKTMKDFPNLKRMTYQKLAGLSDEKIEKLDADIIIVDEFHHCGAPVWGKGVDRLIERNSKAKILGLSATPIRYNDGLRDMADEMFENRVASEMTLEEAIENGILPEATYVSTLYGYEQELGKLQTNIDKMKGNIDNKKQAQDLLNELRKKLDENTKNLPELLSEHMKNKSGKYIIFCKNIDDMKEKMEQAQKMFGGVNSNIKVRGVSSKVKESDRILTEFEQDTDEESLKLLYAVDMISEGYHVKGLDGVVMMRPTYSPTVFTQQLGRVLTVGDDKETVILDLVNNFDSCKIIEDLADRMKQYKGREGINEKEKRKSSRLSIFDTTKEFREIAEKITELTKTKIFIDEKVELNHIFDIDFNEKSQQYNMLVCRIFGEPSLNETFFYSSSAIDAALEFLTEKERDIIVQRYGLQDSLAKTLKEIGEELGISGSYVRIICENALRKIRQYENVKSIIKSKSSLKVDELELLTEEEKEKYEELKKLVYVNARLKPSSKYAQDSEIEMENRENTTKYFKYLRYLERRVELEKSKKVLNENRIDIEDKLYHLKNIQDDDLVEYYLYSITSDVNNSQNKLETSEESNSQNKLETSIENLDLSVRSYNALFRAGIYTVGDIVSRGKEDFYKIHNLGRKSIKEIENKLDSMGISLSDDGISYELQNDKIEDQNGEENDRKKVDYIKYLEGLDFEDSIKIIEDLPANIGDESFKNCDINLSTRAFNVVLRGGTIRDIIKLSTDGKLNEIRNVGNKTINEINNKLESLGLVVQKDEKGKYSEEDLEKVLCMKVKDVIKLLKPRYERINAFIEIFKVQGVESKVKEIILNKNRERIEHWKQQKIQEYVNKLDEIDEKLEKINSKKIENPLEQEQKGITNTEETLKDTLDEKEKKDNENNFGDLEEFPELEKLKNNKEALEKYVKEQEEKIRKAKELLATYEKLSNDIKINSDNENPDFKDD